MTIRFVDLKAQHDEIRADLDAAVRETIDTSSFIGGPAVSDFEDAFAAFCGTKHAIAVASGTDAIEFSLRACGFGYSDIAITTPNTFIATLEGAFQLGGVARFVDVDEATATIDVKQLDLYLSEQCARDDRGVLHEIQSGRRVGAVLPVHLYGLPADMEALLPISHKYGVTVVEDACQAHGAECMVGGAWRKAGSMSRAAAFSFYPGKNLGAIGEAGGIVTDDDEVTHRCRIFRDHGQSERYLHVSADGVNGRMDSLQARVLTLKLRRLDAWNARRREIAEWYREDLTDLPIERPVEPKGRRHVYHLYVIRVAERDRVRAGLTERGIETGLHYPIPLHLQPGLSGYQIREGRFPVSERWSKELLSLPMHPHLSRSDVHSVAVALRALVRQ
jgi:dTDP-4-amino-4,6-dideoxygalactose transaminase